VGRRTKKNGVNLVGGQLKPKKRIHESGVEGSKRKSWRKEGIIQEQRRGVRTSRDRRGVVLKLHQKGQWGAKMGEDKPGGGGKGKPVGAGESKGKPRTIAGKKGTDVNSRVFRRREKERKKT